MDGPHYQHVGIEFHVLAVSHFGVLAETSPTYPPPGYRPPKGKHL